MSDVMKRVEEIEKWYERNLATNEDFESLLQTIKQLHTENERYREALEFYANQDNYIANVTDQWEPITRVINDDGRLARQVLEDTKGGAE